MTPIPPAPPVPSSLDPEVTFDAQWEAFNHWVADDLRPGVNAAASAVGGNATAAAEAAQQAGASAGDAQQAAAAAAQAAASAQAAVADVETWVSGGVYTVNKLVWGTAAPYDGTVYRATAAHSGQATPPQDDAARWVAVGANWSVDPKGDRTHEAVTSTDAAGNITGISFQKSGKPGSDTYTWAGGVVTQEVTTWNGSTWTTTHTWSNGNWAGSTTVRS